MSRRILFASLILILTPVTALAQQSEPEPEQEAPLTGAPPVTEDDASEPRDGDVSPLVDADADTEEAFEDDEEELLLEEDEQLIEGDDDFGVDEDFGFVDLDLWSALPLEFELIGPNIRDRRDAAGAAYTITAQEVRRTAARSTSELLEQLPGVYIADQDTMGLRLNLGMRGFSPSESTYVLILEDGLPIAAAPYLNGAILYTTPVEKIERVELLTGSSSILFGPQNMGGAINLVTRQAPRSFTPRAYLDGGSFGRLRLGAHVGDTKGVVSYLLEAHHRRFEGPRQLDLHASDISAKFRLQVSERSWFGAKVSIYDEFSRASTTGLTQDIFSRSPYEITSPYDRDEVGRLATSISHTYLLGDVATVQTSAWATSLTRDLQAQRFDRSNRAVGDYERIVTGSSDAAADDAGGTLFFLNSTNVQQERYQTLGVESKMTVDIPLGRFGRDELIVGLRGMSESIERQEMRGGHGGAPSGQLLLDEERMGRSTAGYALSRFFLFDENLRVEPGVRLEFLRSERRIWRTVRDGSPVDLNPPLRGADTTTALLPGIGTSLDLGQYVTLFGSAHRSMAVPEDRVAIALVSPTLRLAPEFAWNFDLGSRFYVRDIWEIDISGFLVETQNLSLQRVNIPIFEDGAQESGRSRHYGGEFAVKADPGRYLRSAIKLPISASYTYTQARLVEGWSEPIEGNFMPGVPTHRWSAQAGVEHPIGMAAQLTARYIGERVSDLENVVESMPDGTRGTLDPRLSLDARLAYKYNPWRATFYILGKNLLNEPVIITRDSQGLYKAGAREFMGGVEVAF